MFPYLRPKLLAATLMIAVIAGCTTPSNAPATDTQSSFVLSEQSAIAKLMATQYVASLKQTIPQRRLACWVEGGQISDALNLYLGDNGPDSIHRIGYFRVTRDGKVWVNRDETGSSDRWMSIQ